MNSDKSSLTTKTNSTGKTAITAPRPIFLASDHAGFDLKSVLMKRLPAASLSWGVELQWTDLGPTTSEARVDYPDFAKDLCSRINANSEWKALPSGILVCGSGQGMAMAANKFRDIRAALCLSAEFAQLAREHNDANVLCLAGRFTSADDAVEICHRFFSTRFLGGRHQARVQKLNHLC